MIEEVPKTDYNFPKILQILTDSECMAKIERVNDEYLYWDRAKYHAPKGVTALDFWQAVHYVRRLRTTTFSFLNFDFFYTETLFMQESLHNFDMNFGGTLGSEDFISDKNRQYYLLSSIMEEAIASSKMEGAVTTRKIAKEMLRKQAKPSDLSEQMILNNYNTIRYLSEHKKDPLSPELLLEIHRQISEKTLENPEYEGKFRLDDNIVVQNAITGEVAHTPPSHDKIEEMVAQICEFVNEDRFFVHPIIKAIVLHFMISFLHPFVDGNGRTARSLFYWYMLKKGYWLTEFLSVSRVIYRSKVQYERAFLYTEIDNLDLGYFIHYNLKVLNQAFEELKIYLARKSKEENALLEFRNLGINERQARVLKICKERPGEIFVSRDFETTLNVSVKTIRADLEGLVHLGLLESVPVNKRLVGYTASRK